MKVSGVNNISFKALLGKKEVIHYHGSGIDSVRTIQHVYPFKDEFKSAAEQDKAMEKFRESSFVKNRNFKSDLMQRRLDIVCEDTLPFTKVEYLIAKQCPNMEGVSQQALDFVKSDEHSTTITKHVGFFPCEEIIDGEIKSI